MVALVMLLSMAALPSSALEPGLAAAREEVADATTKEVYEVEDAALSGALLRMDQDDYSGSGFVRLTRVGASVTFTVTADQTGNYGVRLRYANGGTTAVTLHMLVNGQAAGVTTLTKTVNWDTWNEKLESLPLTVGENTITYVFDESDSIEQIHLDKISLSQLYEAEDATVLGGMGNNNDHPGFTGTGFASGFMGNGQGRSFNVTVQEAGQYLLRIRYANGAGDSKSNSLTLNVNGESQVIYLSDMREWDNWGEHRFTVALQAGQNTISLTKESDNKGSVNIDCITVAKCNWTYLGAVESYSGNRTSQLTFTCTNAAVQLTSVSPSILKVWVEPTSRFERMYESFTVVNDAIDPQKLIVSDKGDYYEFVNGGFTVRVQKDPFKLTYLDASGNVILENDEKSMGWSEYGECVVNMKAQENEAFWGLGENLNSFNRRGNTAVMWNVDAYGEIQDSSVPSYEDGRYYGDNPYYISSNGYSILFDNSSRTVFDMADSDPDLVSFGSFNPNPGGELLYYFIYGPEIESLSTQYARLVGSSFFSPAWAFGNIQCHYGYTQSDVQTVAQTYRDKGIALDSMMIDIDWYQYKCSPTTWNTQNFPDPQAMMNFLNRLNCRLGVIDDPNVPVSSGVDYQEGAANGYFVGSQTETTRQITWAWDSEKSGLTDFFNPAAQTWWGNLHQQLFDLGISSFWTDMGEPAAYNTDWYFYNVDGKSYGSLSEVKNVFGMKAHEAMYNKMVEETGRSFVLTRSNYLGSHRYASPWTGDIGASYTSMQQQINMGMSLALTGYSYWGCDIGGFFTSSDELNYKRWIEMSTFLPVHRIHYCAGNTATEPWTHNAEDISRTYINLRERLIPYFYSYTADNIIGIGLESGYSAADGGTGVPLTRPMLLEYQEDQNTWELDTQYLCGESFLVAPVLDGSFEKSVYFPEGNAYWYDYNDGITLYSPGRTVNYYADEATLPVFVKAGSIIPMTPELMYYDQSAIDRMTLDIYPTVSDGDFSFVLYEDDGESEDYASGIYDTTTYTGNVAIQDGIETLTLEIGQRTGNYGQQVARDYLLQFHAAAFDGLTVQVDGSVPTFFASLEDLETAAQNVSGYYVDENNQLVYVKLQDDANAHTVVLAGTPMELNQRTYLAVEADGSNGTTVNGDSVTVPADETLTFQVSVSDSGLFALDVAVEAKEAATLQVLDMDGNVICQVPVNAGAETVPVYGYLFAGKVDLTLQVSQGTLDIVSISVSGDPVLTQITSITGGLQNGGFEMGSTSGWAVTTTPANSYGVDGQNVYNGSYKFYFYNGSAPYTGSLTQTFGGLENGEYLVSCYVKVDNAAPNDAGLRISGYDGDAETVLTTDTMWAYVQLSEKVVIQDHQITLEFFMDGPSTCSMQIDDVEVTCLSSEDDTTVLESNIAACEQVTNEGYTDASWQAFQDTIALAKNLIQVNAPFGILEAASRALLNAQNALEFPPLILLGDMNNDQKLSVADVVLLRKTILANEFDPVGDVNGDQQLSVSDVVLLRKTILYQ